MRISILFSFLFLAYYSSHGQKIRDSSKIDLHGDLLLDHATKNVYNSFTTKVYKTYNLVTQNYILNTKKWLDTTKLIKVYFGEQSSVELSYKDLKKGSILPFDMMFKLPSDSGKNIIKLQITNKRLLISSDISNFECDGYLAVIRNNVLEPVLGRTFQPYYTDKSLEVFESSEHLPILQLELRKSNVIYLAGCFPFRRGWVVVNNDNPSIHLYRGPIDELTKQEKEIEYDKFKQAALQIIPIKK